MTPKPVMPSPDKYDEATSFIIRRVVELRQTPHIALDWEKIAQGEISELLRSAFPETHPLLPPEDETRAPDIGICQGCGSILSLGQMERCRVGWSHTVITSPYLGGDPEPAQCGPVDAYYKRPAPFSEKALREALERIATREAQQILPWTHEAAADEYARMLDADRAEARAALEREDGR